MKYLFLLLTIYFSLIPNKADSINYRNKQFVLVDYNLTIHPQVKPEFDDLLSYFKDIDNVKADKVVSRIMSHTWIILEERLQKEVGMYIFPINTYGDQFDYDVYGYPNTSINKAIRRGTSSFYFKIDMSIEPEIIQSFSITSKTKKDSSQIKPDSTANQGFKPKVLITITSYSDEGILPIEKFTGESISINPWTFEASILDGLVNEKECNGCDNLPFLINEAITNLIKKIPSY